MSHAPNLLLALSLCLSLALFACESASSGPQICAAGIYQICPCADGGDGAQQCLPTGKAWAECSCDSGIAPDVDPWVGDTMSVEEVLVGPDLVGPDLVDQPDLSTPEDTGGECTPQWEKVCNGDVVVWADSCGTLGEVIESCAEIGHCSAGACVEDCLPKHEERCSGNSIYWFDSCGQKESLSLTCGDDELCIGCNEDDELCSKEAQCAKASYNGSWKISANPNVKNPCGLGNSTYLDLIIDLTIDETGLAEATGDAPDYDLHYTGQLTGKNLKMSATYDQNLGTQVVVHEEVMDVNFVDLETFEGISADTFELPVFGGCTLDWDITGVKQ